MVSDVAQRSGGSRAIFHPFELAVVNTYTLYCYNTPKREQLTHLRFRQAVASSLLCDAQPIPPPQYVPSPATANVPLRLTGRHFPEPAGGHPDCKICSDKHAEFHCVYTHVSSVTTHSSITSELCTSKNFLLFT